MDIFVVFNSAYYNEDFELTEDRCKITYDYITGWFLIDLDCIIPFELFFSGGESSNMVRMARFGRINKLLKLLKMLRLVKMQKKNTANCMDIVSEYLALSMEVQWIAIFFFTFILTSHSLICVWIIIATFEEG